MSVFSMRMTRRLPGNRYNPMHTPSGTPIAVEMTVEKADICRVRRIICDSSLPGVNIKLNAWTSSSMKTRIKECDRHRMPVAFPSCYAAAELELADADALEAEALADAALAEAEALEAEALALEESSK